jgi:cyclic nucleotide-binding protein/tetratricopeptide repeat protein
MTKLKELEQRLRSEPDNLGLRVMVAGALHEAGRRADAVELYRSVAVAYRDQGRPQQAITVCRSILELAPDDAACLELLAALVANQAAPRASPPPPSLPVRPSPLPLPRPTPSPLPRASSPGAALRERPEPERPGAGEPVRRPSGETTPLPAPLAYHDADPTTGSLQRLMPADLPPSLREELAAYPEIAGIAAAARQISASLIAASRRAEEQAERTQELDEEDLGTEVQTGPHWRPGGPRGVPSASAPSPLPRAPGARPPTPPPVTPPPATGPDAAAADAAADDDEPTLPPPSGGVPRPAADDDNDKTEPREMPTRVRPPSIAPPTAATGPLAGAFFAPLPPRNRAGVLQRFRRRMITTGATVIRRGEAGHGLVVVVRGRLDLHAERADGVPIALGTIGPGEFIGEASLLAGEPATDAVVAAVDCELLVLAAEDFHDVIRSFPALRVELEAVAARRARDHEQRLRG